MTKIWELTKFTILSIILIFVGYIFYMGEYKAANLLIIDNEQGTLKSYGKITKQHYEQIIQQYQHRNEINDQIIKNYLLKNLSSPIIQP